MEAWTGELRSVMEELLRHDCLSIAYPDWQERLAHDGVAVLLAQGLPEYLEEHAVEEAMLIASDLASVRYPPRCSGPSCILGSEDYFRYLTQIQHLCTVPQPDQRTPEWYKFRHDHITASSAWKLIAGGRSADAFIYDKCQPLVEPDVNASPSAPATETPMHWGVRFEPVSVEWYERQYSTTVSEFGCIPHPAYPFLAASPDGIITKPNCPRLGRMLEIKNIVNRPITGIPKMEYWIQMQLQMEVCDLDECDFLETRFREFDTYEQYVDESVRQKGIVMFFLEGVTPIYEYGPMHLDARSLEAWEREQMRHHQDLGHAWVKNIYWYLDQVSCVLVERDREWFRAALPVLSEAWRSIVKERKSGCEHRAPKRKPNRASSEPVKRKCLIDVSKLDFSNQADVFAS